MASHDPPDSAAATSQDTMFLHRQDEILATRWRKTAVASEPGTDEPLISADQDDGELLRDPQQALDQAPHHVVLCSFRRKRRSSDGRLLAMA